MTQVIMNRNGETDLQESELDQLRDEASLLGVDLHSGQTQTAIKARRERAVLYDNSLTSAKTARQFREVRRRVAAFVGSVVLYLSLFTGYVLPPVGVVGLWVVEIVGVYLGVKHWGMPGIADELTAITAVSVYVSLLFVRSSKTQNTVEHKKSYGLWRRNVLYRIGFGKAWEPQSRTDVEQLNDHINRLAVVIVLLGSVGFFSGAMAWYELLLGGFARWVLLSVMHYSIDSTYAQFVQILPPEELADFFGVSSASFSSEAGDVAEMMYLRNRIDKIKQAQSN